MTGAEYKARFDHHLFATLEGLADEEKPLDIERARAIAQVSQTVIEAAKLEVKFMEVTGEDSGSSFFPVSETVRAERTRRALLGTRMEN